MSNDIPNWASPANREAAARTPPLDAGPASIARAVTPSDTVELAPWARALWVGGAGNVAVLPLGDTNAVTFAAVAAGTLLPIACSKVLQTNTTATNIVALA